MNTDANLPFVLLFLIPAVAVAVASHFKGPITKTSGRNDCSLIGDKTGEEAKVWAAEFGVMRELRGQRP